MRSKEKSLERTQLNFMEKTMNHPTQNEWLNYLDGDASPKEANRLREHLQQCPMCATEIAGWKRSAQKLRHLPFPAPRKARPDRRPEMLRVSPFAKWGLAAAIVLCVGIAFGRQSVLRGGSFQHAVAAQVREDLRRELQADLLAALDPESEVKDGFQRQLRHNVQSTQTKLTNQNVGLCRELIQMEQQQRQQDQQRVLALINGLHDQQVSDTLALRRDLETAVSTADSDLRQDSRRISELADTLLAAQR
jgi:hypothetical protein